MHAPLVELRRTVPGAVSILLAALLLPAASFVPQEPAPIPAGDAAALPAVVRQVDRHGVTWRFDQPYVVGAFVNGDPWVVGPVRIVAIEPRAIVRDGRAVHGAMLDPPPGRPSQGYDSALCGTGGDAPYLAALDVAADVAAGRRIELRPGTSLVSVVSALDGAPPMLQSAAVLTCVAAPPPPDAFRPPYVGGDDGSPHRAAELDFAPLQRLAPVPGAPPMAMLERLFERVWLEHLPPATEHCLHAREGLPGYGRDFAAAVGSAALWLNCDLPNERKRVLLIEIVQLGIDLYAALRGGCRWPGEGGQGHGRKLPILIAGLVLHDEPMLAVGRDHPATPIADGGSGAWFGEDGQTFFVRETAPGVCNHGHGGYTRDQIGLPEWGFAHAIDASRDDARWDGDPHRLCCTANAWVGEALAARIMGLEAAWHHPAFFAYVDRYLQVEAAEPWQRAWVAWHGAMWDAYRSNY